MKASQDFIKDKILFWGNIYNFFSARKGYDNLRWGAGCIVGTRTCLIRILLTGIVIRGIP